MNKAREISGRFLFEEVQHFPRWFRIVLAMLMGSSLLITVVSLVATSAGEDRTEVREAVLVILLVILINGLSYFLIVNMKLEKQVTSNGIYYRWLPYQKKYSFMEKSDLASFDIKKSPAMSYGAKRVPGYGKTHNLSDGKGLQFHLADGKKIFFGSSDVDGFSKAVKEMMQRHHR
jgi:hypothetical protein